MEKIKTFIGYLMMALGFFTSYGAVGGMESDTLGFFNGSAIIILGLASMVVGGIMAKAFD